MSDTPITKGMMDRAAQDVFSKPPMTGKDTVIAFINFITDEVIALERRLIAEEAENAALQQLINDVANKINGKAPIVHVASWGNELLIRINAARK